MSRNTKLGLRRRDVVRAPWDRVAGAGGTYVDRVNPPHQALLNAQASLDVGIGNAETRISELRDGQVDVRTAYRQFMAGQHLNFAKYSGLALSINPNDNTQLDITAGTARIGGELVSYAGGSLSFAGKSAGYYRVDLSAYGTLATTLRTTQHPEEESVWFPWDPPSVLLPIGYVYWDGTALSNAISYMLFGHATITLPITVSSSYTLVHNVGQNVVTKPWYEVQLCLQDPNDTVQDRVWMPGGQAGTSEDWVTTSRVELGLDITASDVHQLQVTTLDDGLLVLSGGGRQGSQKWVPWAERITSATLIVNIYRVA